MLKVALVMLSFVAFFGVNVFVKEAYASKGVTIEKFLNKKITIYDTEESFEGEEISKKKLNVPQAVLKISKSGNRFLIPTPKGDKWVDSFEVQILEKSKSLSTVERSRSKVSGGRGIAD